ncbi:exosortase H [Geobacter pickeringii]|uniref:exosortase H n=1 Tax=Geobacter pickeringii TaxID=345632 RepID=UPI00068D173C|nr:exosortase H [Geobacter pickeringii]
MTTNDEPTSHPASRNPLPPHADIGNGRTRRLQTAIFTLLVTLLCTASVLLPERVFAPLERQTARTAAMILTLSGFAPQVSGPLITDGGFSVRVVTECTALYMAIVYASFILAFQTTFRERVAGLLCGIPLLHLLNCLRIAAVFAVGAMRPALFEAIHVYLGQTAMVLAVCAVSLFWLGESAAIPAEGGRRFVLRAIAWSAIPFLFWLFLNRSYVIASDRLLAGIFAAAGHPLLFPHEHLLYFQTFNVVTFCALILAGRTVTVKRKFAWLAVGLPLLAAGHLAVRLANVLFSAFGMNSAIIAATGVGILGQYLLPVLLWLYFARKYRHDSPLCGP